MDGHIEAELASMGMGSMPNYASVMEKFPRCVDMVEEKAVR
jgi:hypothetical protein